MKITHKIPETGYEVCLIGLPDEYCYGFEIQAPPMHPFLNFCINEDEGIAIGVTDGKPWQFLSTLSDITEEKLEEMMPSQLFFYLDYIDTMWDRDCALDSLRSLMDSLKIYTVNPFKNGEPSKLNHDVWYTHEDWQQAQQRTFKEWAILARKID